MKVLFNRFLCCTLLLHGAFLRGQTVLEDVKLDRLYSGSLDYVFESLSKEHGLVFKYDREKIKAIDVAERPMKISLGQFLTNICKRFKLKYYLDDEGAIHVVEKHVNIEAVATSTSANSVEKSAGPPENFDFNLSGYVKDRETGEALPYAVVMLKGSANAVETNANGFFTLQNVPSDTAVLQISYLGYLTTYVRLDPKMSKNNLILEMTAEPESVTELEEVVIKSEREDLMQLNKHEGLSMIKMSPKQISNLPNIGERDIMRSMQLMPGIASSNESSSGLYVRGGTPDQNLVVYDGFTVYQVDHLYGFFSAFNPNALKDIQLYKGGYESRFGGRLSSVTEITGKDGNEKKMNAGGDLSLLGVNGYIESPIGQKATFILAARKSYKGLLYNKIFDTFNSSSSSSQGTQSFGPGGGNNQTQATSYFYDINSKFTYKPNKKDAISLSFFNGTDKLDNGFKLNNYNAPAGMPSMSLNINNTDLTKYGNTGASLRWNRNWNPKIYGSTLVSFSNYFSKRDRTNTITNTDDSGDEQTRKMGIMENNNLKDFSLKTDYTYDLSSKHQLGFGAFATRFFIKYSFSQNDTSSILDKSDQGSLLGTYLQDKIKLMNNKLLLTPGIRLNYFDQTNKMYYEPRFNASYAITPKLSARVATGKFYQFTNRIVREDILSGSKDFWLLSNNTNIPVSSSLHYIAGFSYETPKYVFAVEGYYKDLKGLSEYSLRYTSSRQNISYEENFYTGSGYSKGVEFLAQKKFGKLNGWVSYTLSQSRNKFEVYSPNYFPAYQDVTNEFKVVSMYKWRKWNFSATWIYATGKPYTAPAGAYSVTLLDGTTQDYYSTSDKNSLRLPAYHRLDLAANYTLRFKDSANDVGSIGFSLFNVYDRKNIWYKQYSIVDSDIVVTNVNYLGITPNITLTLKLR